MKLNLNDKVRVQLTPLGRAILRSDHFKLYSKYPPNSRPEFKLPAEDADGWSDWTAWDLFNQFGPYLHNGFDVPFNTDIEWEVKDAG